VYDLDVTPRLAGERMIQGGDFHEVWARRRDQMNSLLYHAIAG
jgi:hypothetical protein